MSRLAPCVAAALCAVVAPASAQPPPRVRTPTTAGSQLTAVTPPLGADEVRRLCRRLRDSLDRQAAAAPTSTTLRSAGLPAESDAVEHADRARQAGTVGPIGIGLVRAAPARAQRLAVDPALAEVTRLRLRSRLDRDPTAAELAAELQAYDARIAQANRWLSDNRTGIAKAYAAAGTLPPDFDDAAVDPPPARPPESAATQAGFRNLFRALLTLHGPDVSAPLPSPQGSSPPATTIGTPSGAVVTTPAQPRISALTALTCAGP